MYSILVHKIVYYLTVDTCSLDWKVTIFGEVVENVGLCSTGRDLYCLSTAVTQGRGFFTVLSDGTPEVLIII
jgi:hypothetical protein